MTRPQRAAFTTTTLALLLCAAFLARLHYNRAHCQEIYGTNPWNGESTPVTPWWCRTPAEDRRIRELARGEK